LPLRAAVSFNVLASPTCAPGARFIDLPEVAGEHPVTATTKAALLEDGGETADGAQVRLACMWAEFPQGLLFDGSIQIRAAGATSGVNLGSTLIVEGEPAVGGLVMTGALLSEQYNAPTNSCTLTPLEIDTEANSVWGKITCPAIESLDSESVCEVGESYFYFENCLDI
jgi:hypothetical protein